MSRTRKSELYKAGLKLAQTLCEAVTPLAKPKLRQNLHRVIKDTYESGYWTGKNDAVDELLAKRKEGEKK